MKFWLIHLTLPFLAAGSLSKGISINNALISTHPPHVNRGIRSTNLSKRQASRRIDDCPPKGSRIPREFAIFGGSFCMDDESDTRGYLIECHQHIQRFGGHLYTRKRWWYSSCKKHEQCFEGSPSPGQLPAAWCVSGEAFVTLASAAISTYNRIGASNYTEINATISNETSLSNHVKTIRSNPNQFNASDSNHLYVIPQNSNKSLELSLTEQKTGYPFLANRMGISPRNESGDPIGRSVSCSSCSSLSYSNSLLYVADYVVSIALPANNEHIFLYLSDEF